MSADRRRDQILDATRTIVDTEGFAAVTITRVAEAAGITRTLVYHQFTDLPGLLTALIDREAERAMAGLLTVIAETPPAGRDPFTAALQGLISAADADPAAWRMFLMPSEGGPPELYERIDQGRALGRARIIEMLTTPDHPVPTGPDPSLTVHLLHLVGDELLRLHLQDPQTYPADRILAQCAHMAAQLSLPPSPGHGHALPAGRT
ncbi:TetR/AcrR family transcriptional regulator [Spirillospora sp. NPDC048824]|uniref:TetR/AcrR family transcriptional regulator n=1 Tax=Spirillospora sp. NPDC048824 TaxID=3364526 RepID=UPI003718E025